MSPAVSYVLDCAESLLKNRQLLVLSGAGISTGAGLPDYRGQGQSRRHSPSLDAFLGSKDVREAFWRQTFEGWSALDQARPTFAHERLAQLELDGRVAGVVTQNVDGLHQSAGSAEVVELHGRDDVVRCMKCQGATPRAEFADVDLRSIGASAMVCHCGGLLRPAITFFGEDVDSTRLRASFEMMGRAEALLILGTSLRVNSGLQLARSAAAQGKPIVLINLGWSAATEIADVTAQTSVDEGLRYLFGN
jgi:NAD-dependent SIR2 family protein deacetylase